ncbi:hypothetical protein ICG_02480 [Bacillus cereus BAG1X1-3]|nr:hypothetical protein ICG_02480 [Bacillus cereus BAG1X1-3]EOO76619.1 hypothetical protein IC7_02417 [Bacillus cereus BAG1O-1]MDR4171100.1 M15 family metallopeptidase [Bacillus nitratireducens]OSX92272.1 D-alanyl-D-alanine carboxypeptidase [Bacillus mycoides]
MQSAENNEVNKSRYLERTGSFFGKTGHSKHQTGLTMDVKSTNNELELSCAKTKEGKWPKANAHRAGDIIRYPKENITGYAYEPWHIRCVGDIAKNI